MGMIKLLELSVKEGISIYEKKIIKDIACMLNFLPKREVNVTKLGEPELWSRYCNPLLTSMLSENENNVILRWTNKAADNYSSKWSDAIISAMNEEVCLGYGECKLGSVSGKAPNMDILKLTIYTQRTINIDSKQNVFSFNIEDFKINFCYKFIE